MLTIPFIFLTLFKATTNKRRITNSLKYKNNFKMLKMKEESQKALKEYLKAALKEALKEVFPEHEQ